MSTYRFKVGEGGALVLQVLVSVATPYNYAGERKETWRDATVEDIPVSDPFASTPVPAVVWPRGD